MTNDSRFSLIFYASPNVAAILIDETGEKIGKSSVGTPEDGGAFRTITVKRPFQNSKWKLRLENREPAETEIAITAFIDYNSTVFE